MTCRRGRHSSCSDDYARRALPVDLASPSLVPTPKWSNPGRAGGRIAAAVRSCYRVSNGGFSHALAHLVGALMACVSSGAAVLGCSPNSTTGTTMSTGCTASGGCVTQAVGAADLHHGAGRLFGGYPCGRAHPSQVSIPNPASSPGATRPRCQRFRRARTLAGHLFAFQTSRSELRNPSRRRGPVHGRGGLAGEPRAQAEPLGHLEHGDGRGVRRHQGAGGVDALLVLRWWHRGLRLLVLKRQHARHGQGRAAGRGPS